MVCVKIWCFEKNGPSRLLDEIIFWKSSGMSKMQPKVPLYFSVPTSLCDFSSQQTDFMDTKGSNVYLPVCVIDEDLQASPPDLLISTVDKFAMLAWKPELRSFFGIGTSIPEHRYHRHPA